MESLVQFTKIRNVKNPNRAHTTDAGTDFYIPEYSEDFYQVLREKNSNNNLEYILDTDEPGIMTIAIPAGEQIMIPSGIRVWINDKNTYLQATNKSGIASKFHLTVGANTIDADYQGEVHINLLNCGNTTVYIKTGQKIVQFIHREYINTIWEEIDNTQYEHIGVSSRGNGGFGSTGI